MPIKNIAHYTPQAAFPNAGADGNLPVPTYLLRYGRVQLLALPLLRLSSTQPIRIV